MHEALQYQCAKVKTEVQEVRRELQRQSMEVEDNDLVRMGMETQRMRAEDKDVGAKIEEPSHKSRRTRRCRRQDATTGAARSVATHGEADAASGGAATHGEAAAATGATTGAAPWYVPDVDMTPWVSQWDCNVVSNDHWLKQLLPPWQISFGH